MGGCREKREPAKTGRFHPRNRRNTGSALSETGRGGGIRTHDLLNPINQGVRPAENAVFKSAGARSKHNLGDKNGAVLALLIRGDTDGLGPLGCDSLAPSSLGCTGWWVKPIVQRCERVCPTSRSCTAPCSSTRPVLSQSACSSRQRAISRSGRRRRAASMISGVDLMAEVAG